MPGRLAKIWHARGFKHAFCGLRERNADQTRGAGHRQSVVRNRRRVHIGCIRSSYLGIVWSVELRWLTEPGHDQA